MRILLVYADVNNGSSFYRLQMPHHFIEDTEKDIQTFSCDKPEELDEYPYDFVLFSRSVNLEGRTEEIISKILCLTTFKGFFSVVIFNFSSCMTLLFKPKLLSLFLT